MLKHNEWSNLWRKGLISAYSCHLLWWPVRKETQGRNLEVKAEEVIEKDWFLWCAPVSDIPISHRACNHPEFEQPFHNDAQQNVSFSLYIALWYLHPMSIGVTIFQYAFIICSSYIPLLSSFFKHLMFILIFLVWVVIIISKLGKVCDLAFHFCNKVSQTKKLIVKFMLVIISLHTLLSTLLDLVYGSKL